MVEMEATTTSRGVTIQQPQALSQRTVRRSCPLDFFDVFRELVFEISICAGERVVEGWWGDLEECDWWIGGRGFGIFN